jgi:CRISPR/Cas system Type II protein with McrA/HNH and RuvC-like nuclease domain
LDTEKPCGNSLLQQRISPRITTKFSLRDFSMNHNPVSEIYRDKGLGALTFGFDIGIASVGWAVLSDTHIVDLGVRCFPAAEDPKEKISLNQARRSARTGRNRNAQRRSRLNRLEQLFVDIGLLSPPAVKCLFANNHIPGIRTKDIWELRSQALTRALDAEELARILHHLVKWRGYGSLRDAKDRQENDTKDDKDMSTESDDHAKSEVANSATAAQKKKPLSFGKALDKTATLIERLLPKYETIGNLVYQLSVANLNNLGSFEEREAAQLYQKAKHNHSDGYERSQLRKHLRQEIQAIFIRQREHGNLIADEVVPADKPAMAVVVIGSVAQQVNRFFESQALALFDEQYPPIVSEHMEQLIGFCQLEPTEKRAPKWSFSNERSHWLQTLNKLKVRVAGDPKGERFLSSEERAALLDLPYLKTDVTYADLRAALCEKADWPRDWRLANFATLRYRSVATPQSDQIKVIQTDGVKIKLLEAVVLRISKTDKKAKTKALDAFKEWLVVEAETRDLTFASIRSRLALDQDCRFSMVKKIETAVLPDAEASQFIPLSNGGEEPLKSGFFLKTRSSKEKNDQKLSGQALSTLRQWCQDSRPRTMAELRTSLPPEYWPGGNWQFVLEERNPVEPSLEQEAANHIDLSFSDAQSVEKDTRFARLPGWHKLKNALFEVDPSLWAAFQSAWQVPMTPDGMEAAKRIDEIFEALTKKFTDTEIENALAGLTPAIPPPTRQALLKIVSTGFAHLSFLALRTIRPMLEDGHVYSKACELSPKGYDHSGSRSRRVAAKYLPKLETFLFRRISVKTNDVKKRPLRGGFTADVVEKRFKDLANPVVARSFNQARNVLNALVRTYGSPAYVSIELARDMSKPGSLRKEIDKESKARAVQKEKERDTFVSTHGVVDPSPALMRRVRMRNEQDCKCMYSGKCIDLDRLLSDEKYVEVDHVLPRSRTADNSLDNQVLVLAGENQRKANRTPYEWKAGADPAWWHAFKVTVQNLPLMSDRKKQKLLLEKLDDDGFTGANLVDTRYVTRLFARVVREGLVFHAGALAKDETINPDDSGRDKKDRFMRARVRTPQGGVTSMLRGLWGLSKNRDAGDLHHAVDACVAAAATPKLIQRLNEFNRFKEKVIITPNGMAVWRECENHAEGEILTPAALQEFVEKEFPQPFHPQMFHQEVMTRLSHDGRTYLTKHGTQRSYDFSNYSETATKIIRPVTVSRLVQRNRRNNELHDAQPKALRSVQIPLTEMTVNLLNLDRYPKEFSKQNRTRFMALSDKLSQHNGNANTAFADGFVELGKTIEAIPIPWLFLTEDEQQACSKRSNSDTKDFKGSYELLPLTKLTLDDLTPNRLGEDIWRREQLLIQALREKLSKPNAKAAEIFAHGFPKPESAKGKERRLRLGVVDFKPPIVTTLRVPKQIKSGFVIRGGIVGQGAATSVLVARNRESNHLEFIPRYAAKKVYAVGLPDQKPTLGQRGLFELLPSTYIAVKHPNVIYCFAETGRRQNQEGTVLIDIQPIFPDGIFYGYFNNYEPSLGRPVLRLHDNAPFFLLADDREVDLTLKQLTLVVRVKPNTRKNAAKGKANETREFVLHDDLHLEKPRTFALTTEISRKIGSAELFQVVPIDNLGRTGS